MGQVNESTKPSAVPSPSEQNSIETVLDLNENLSTIIRAGVVHLAQLPREVFEQAFNRSFMVTTATLRTRRYVALREPCEAAFRFTVGHGVAFSPINKPIQMACRTRDAPYAVKETRPAQLPKDLSMLPFPIALALTLRLNLVMRLS